MLHLILDFATLSSTIGRIIFLAEKWQQGLRFENIVLLGGQRILDSQFESLKYILNDPYLANKDKEFFTSHWREITTESDMIQWLFLHMQATKPLRKHINLVIINTPNKLNPDGKISRPTTRDAIANWLAFNPKNGTCLAISDQPHILYQQSVLASCLPPELCVETVGPAITKEITLAETLDAMARLLFQEKNRLSLLAQESGLNL